MAAPQVADALADAADLLDIRAPASALFTYAQAAGYLQVSPRTIRRWVAEGRIESRRLTVKTVRIERAELDRFIAGDEVA